MGTPFKVDFSRLGARDTELPTDSPSLTQPRILPVCSFTKTGGCLHILYSFLCHRRPSRAFSVFNPTGAIVSPTMFLMTHLVVSGSLNLRVKLFHTRCNVITRKRAQTMAVLSSIFSTLLGYMQKECNKQISNKNVWRFYSRSVYSVREIDPVAVRRNQSNKQVTCRVTL
ncbi:hypothetical protein AVEN_55736-1 [Araneus ventricosus]|uniref:Uncharacterized protein n=1 Tax=Araneus ventricosus TaxID=182803 RepID=A0A4Y2QR14_ARAVE|nr:hypothetical protein AVEN_55736-1 [Araneus ventricosus]